MIARNVGLAIIALGVLVVNEGRSHASALKAADDATVGLAAAQTQATTGSHHGPLAGLNTALGQRQGAKVREIVAQMLAAPSLESDVLMQAGILLAQQEFYPEASEVFTRCARDHPQVFEAHYNLALSEFAQQKFSTALAALKQAPQNSRQQQLARLYLRGKIYDALGQPSEAESDLTAAFTGAPQQENYAADFGLFLLRRQAYPAAAEVFERGVSFNRRSPFLWLGLALARYLAGQQARCIEACRQLLEITPGFSPARLLMAFALYMDQELAEAERVTAAALATADPHPYLYYLHAAILLKMRSSDYDRMLSELQKASAAIPGCSLCSLGQGKVHEARGDLASAISAFEKAASIDPTFADPWYRLARLYQRTGRDMEASQARAKFNQLKEQKVQRETEAIRKIFLDTLGGKGP